MIFSFAFGVSLFSWSALGADQQLKPAPTVRRTISYDELEFKNYGEIILLDGLLLRSKVPAGLKEFIMSNDRYWADRMLMIDILFMLTRLHDTFHRDQIYFGACELFDRYVYANQDMLTSGDKNTMYTAAMACFSLSAKLHDGISFDELLCFQDKLAQVFPFEMPKKQDLYRVEALILETLFYDLPVSSMPHAMINMVLRLQGFTSMTAEEFRRTSKMASFFLDNALMSPDFVGFEEVGLLAVASLQLALKALFEYEDCLQGHPMLIDKELKIKAIANDLIRSVRRADLPPVCLQGYYQKYYFAEGDLDLMLKNI